MTIGVGKTYKLLPIASQDFGTIVQFKWDMDGDGIYEDSAVVIKEITRTYTDAKTYLAKFYVKDSEGNDTVVTKKITVVNGPVLQIISPKNGTYSTTNSIEIIWSVNGALRKDSSTLVEGPNTITRSTQDINGIVITASALVTLDTKPPKNPMVKNIATLVNTKNPAWSWTSGGEGSGVYRIRC